MPTSKREVADPGSAPHHRRQRGAAVRIDRDLFDEAEDAPRAAEPGRGHLALLGDPAALGVGVKHAAVARIVGDEAGIAFMAADKQCPLVGAARKRGTDEARQEQSSFRIDRTKGAAAEQMLDQLPCLSPARNWAAR